MIGAAMAALPAHGSNLPTPLAPLIGRERETAAATSLLLRPDVRLLALTGPGGVGKTRLAVQVAAVSAPSFADGVWFVPLDAVRAPALVVPTIAQALDLREIGGKSTPPSRRPGW
jgi:predicted ATPase